MIFRKVSDLKREKELAEKRKNDPALNQSQDHLVRKLFSKFKKTNTSSDMSALVPMRDPERGESSPCISRNNSMSTMFPPKVPDVNENGNGNVANITNCKPPTSSILNVNKSTNKVNSELTTLTETTEKQAQAVTPASASPAAPITLIKSKPMANGPRGWGRLKGKTNNNHAAEQTNSDKETFPKQEPLKLINDSQSEAAAETKSVIKESEAHSSSTSSETKEEKEELFIPAVSILPAKPKFNIPKLSLSSDNESSANVIGPGPDNMPLLPMHPPEYTQLVSNLMDFKVC